CGHPLPRLRYALRMSLLLRLTEGLRVVAGGCRRGFIHRFPRVGSGIGTLVRLAVWLAVAFPAHKTVAFKPYAETASFRVPVTWFAIVGVVPAITAEDVLQCGRTQKKTYLFPGHTGFQAGYLFRRDPIALLDVWAIRKAPFGTAAGGQGHHQNGGRYAGSQRLRY